jgi:hypothetical protein
MNRAKEVLSKFSTVNEANTYVATYKGVSIFIKGFKKGDDTEEIGAPIYNAVGKTVSGLDKKVKKVTVELA